MQVWITVTLPDIRATLTRKVVESTHMESTTVKVQPQLGSVCLCPFATVSNEKRGHNSKFARRCSHIFKKKAQLKSIETHQNKNK